MDLAVTGLLALPLLLGPGAGVGASHPPDSGARISFDFQAAEAMIGVLGGGAVVDAASVADLPGNVRMIEHQRRFDRSATRERLIENIRELAAGKKLSSDTFQLEKRSKTRLEATRGMLARIRANPGKLAEQVQARIGRYLPANRSFPVQVYFIVGGTSDGFADGPVFCIAVDYFGDDDAGLRTLMAHELFHVGSRAAVDSGSKAAKKRALSKEGERLLPLFENTMNEGIASRVGDPTLVSDGKAWIEWFQGKFAKNFERLDSSFILFDTVLYREFHDPDVSTEDLYRIGFSGSFDSVFYFVGYDMARVIEEEDGPEAIARCLEEGPLSFFSRYIAISQRRPEKSRRRFSRETEQIVRNLAAK